MSLSQSMVENTDTAELKLEDRSLKAQQVQLEPSLRLDAVRGRRLFSPDLVKWPFNTALHSAVAGHVREVVQLLCYLPLLSPSVRLRRSFCLVPKKLRYQETCLIFLPVHQIFSFAWNQIFAPLIFSSFHYAQKKKKKENILYFDQENDAWEAFHYRGCSRTEEAESRRRATVSPTGWERKNCRGPGDDEGWGQRVREDTWREKNHKIRERNKRKTRTNKEEEEQGNLIPHLAELCQFISIYFCFWTRKCISVHGRIVTFGEKKQKRRDRKVVAKWSKLSIWAYCNWRVYFTCLYLLLCNWKT